MTHEALTLNGLIVQPPERLKLISGVWVKQRRDSPRLAAVFPRVNFFYLASYPDLT
jgi:hypothetical protein